MSFICKHLDCNFFKIYIRLISKLALYYFQKIKVTIQIPPPSLEAREKAAGYFLL